MYIYELYGIYVLHVLKKIYVNIPHAHVLMPAIDLP